MAIAEILEIIHLVVDVWSIHDQPDVTLTVPLEKSMEDVFVNSSLLVNIVTAALVGIF